MPIIRVKGHDDFVEQIKPDEFIIIFKAAWELSSVAMSKILEDSASKNPKFTFYLCDIGEYDFGEELKEYGIYALPTVIYARRGYVYEKLTGTATRLRFSKFSGLD